MDFGGTKRGKFPSKIIEAIAEQAGHVVLRLPPYHCELSPIDLALAAEKNYVAAENKDMTLCSVEKLFIKKRSELPGEFWTNCAEHVKKVKESYTESDKLNHRFTN